MKKVLKKFKKSVDKEKNKWYNIERYRFRKITKYIEK